VHPLLAVVFETQLSTLLSVMTSRQFVLTNALNWPFCEDRERPLLTWTPAVKVDPIDAALLVALAPGGRALVVVVVVVVVGARLVDEVLKAAAPAMLAAPRLIGTRSATATPNLPSRRRRSVGTFTALSSQGSANLPTSGRADRSRYPPPRNQASEQVGASRGTL